MMDEGYMRVKEVAAKIGMSEDWVRRAFGEIEGVRKLKSPAKRFKRLYTILLIPAAMVERELKRMFRLTAEYQQAESLQVIRCSSAP